MPKPIIRYKRAGLDRNTVGSDCMVCTYKNDGEPLQPIGWVTELKYDDSGNLIRFENHEAIYVQVKA